MKSEYHVQQTSKQNIKPLLEKYHYLSQIQRGFKSGFNYALYHNGDIVGVCIFTGIPVKELLKGMLGGSFTDDQSGLFELSRLVMHPDTQENEHNITSWFVAKSIKLLRKDTNVKLILSYADDGFHKGTIYRATGFDYYGMTAPKKDFFFELEDGTFKKHSRGTVKGMKGEWRVRNRKHRFLKVFDKSLSIQWTKI
jgi:hypothetical protein